MKKLTNWSIRGLLLTSILASVSCMNETHQKTQQNQAATYPDWTQTEIAILKAQSLASLQSLPPDPSNKHADNPAAAKLGQKIFFDNRFSLNGKVSCSTCHNPDKAFTDGLARSKGIGQAQRSAPGISGVAYSSWFFWGGRADSQWSQALGPLENSQEHGGDRSYYAHKLFDDAGYRSEYEAVFDKMPDISSRDQFPERASPLSSTRDILEAWYDMTSENQDIINRIFTNMGKAITAYERLLVPGESRFDHYVTALTANDKTAMQKAMTKDEANGLRLFTGKAMCVTCHQGPLFTHNGFHNVGIPFAKDQNKDYGRFDGVRKALKDEFNCLGTYSDAKEEDCAELRFAKIMRDETLGAFKVPSLRNVARTAPYMHSGQFKTLAEVLNHYNTRPKAPIGHSDLLPIELNPQELKQLEAFLHTLSGPPAREIHLLHVPRDIIETGSS
jgi:cytochrome c peroxidase